MNPVTVVGEQSNPVAGILGKTLSYIVFVGWALLTILPLFWLAYSSLKSNEELTRDIYAFPHDLFDNFQDEYRVITPDLNTILDYDPKVDTRERIVIESTTIAPSRRLMVHFLVKEEMPPEIQALQVGDTLRVDQLPRQWQRRIDRKTKWFNYTSAWIRGGMTTKFLNSIIYAGGSTFIIIMLGMMMSFAVSKLPFKRLSGIVLGLVGLGYLLSINSVIIPLFLMLTNIGLTDTHLGIMLVYVAFGFPMAILLGSQFMRGLPDSLLESATIDGATYFQAFLRIIMPMTTPVIITISIISGLGIWNEFLLVLVFASSEATKSLPVGVYSFSSLTGTQLGWQLAALVIATVPVVTIYLLYSKQLTKGVVAGAVKG
jgi:raffinose/stachyose/melibiose transport system permease protein